MKHATLKEPGLQLIHVGDATEALSVSRRHLRRLIAERKIPFVRIGGVVRFSVSALREWIAAGGTPASEDDSGGRAVRHDIVHVRKD